MYFLNLINEWKISCEIRTEIFGQINVPIRIRLLGSLVFGSVTPGRDYYFAATKLSPRALFVRAPLNPKPPLFFPDQKVAITNPNRRFLLNGACRGEAEVHEGALHRGRGLPKDVRFFFDNFFFSNFWYQFDRFVM